MNIAFVPIRCGSKSIPHKNIKPINGKPLAFWVLNALEKSSVIDQIYVAVDCSEFEDVVNSFGMNKVEVYRRKAENALDTSSTEDVMLEFLDAKPELLDSNTFVLVQATSPLVKSDDFNRAFDLMKENDADSLLTAVLVKNFFWKSDGIPINYDYNKRPRRQDFEGWFQENGAFYINSIGNIKKNRNRLSGTIAVYPMPEYTAFEIDEPHDWIIIEELLKRYSQEDS